MRFESELKFMPSGFELNPNDWPLVLPGPRIDWGPGPRMPGAFIFGAFIAGGFIAGGFIAGGPGGLILLP
mgnify:CR=1 FL=1